MKNEIKINVGISSCLLGNEVRFDGGHKHDRYITGTLGRFFNFVPVCPELEVGMGLPRESVNLRGDVNAPLMIGNKTGEDWTDRMSKFNEKRSDQLARFDLRGYLLKKNSPSCGMTRVKLYPLKGGQPERKARGMWADTLISKNPLMPVEEEGRLHDIPLRENFIVRVFAYDRLMNLFDGGFKRSEIVAFHTAHKYLLLAHNPNLYRGLGKLVAAVKSYKPLEFKTLYSEAFMETLSYKSTTAKNVNVLQHIMGFLRKHLADEDRRYITNVIEDYRKELVPLVVPITLIKQNVEKYDIEYIRDQYYLSPHPKELMLRNHV